MAIGTVPSASSCCEELYILLDEEPFHIVQSTFGHREFSGMFSFLSTSMSSFGLCALIRVSTSLSDGGDGGGVSSNRPPVLEMPFDRFNLLPPFYDIERHSHETYSWLVFFYMGVRAHVYLSVPTMGKGHNVGWMKRVSVSVSSLSSLTSPPLSLSTTSLTSMSAKNFVSEKYEKDAIRSGTCKEDLYQHKIELDRQKIELDQLRKKLDEYKIELEQDASFLKSGGAELTVESSLPIVLDKMLRAGSIRGSTYQREEVGNPAATAVTMKPPTNTKAEPCPGSMATAQQNQDSFSFFSFLLEPPPSSVAVSHRRLPRPPQPLRYSWKTPWQAALRFTWQQTFRSQTL
jgi:hypothetical protein